MTFYLVAGTRASTGPATSAKHLPSGRVRRYPSDMTDTEWAVLAPLVPAGGTGPRGGRPPTHSRRDSIDAIRYVTHNGGVWRALPADHQRACRRANCFAAWSSSSDGKPRNGAAAIVPTSMASNQPRDRHGVEIRVALAGCAAIVAGCRSSNRW
ncbi:transposase [Micromonospora zhanjiangensis]|uniref:Transposase n=1 Tax=Micromonospora zhanjiangensis TaxID=1522057 RepID=A0ABV8KYA8_9ACTN